LAGTPIGDRLETLSLDGLRRSTAEFRNDGLSGFNDPDHLQQGLAAVQRRRNGEFDEYSRQKFEEQWGDDDDDLKSYSDDDESARALDDFNGRGSAASDEEMANAPGENEEESAEVRNGEYDSRPNNHHHRKDDDENPPDGPTAAFHVSQPGLASIQVSQTSESQTTDGQQNSSNTSQPGQTTSWEAYFEDYANIAPLTALEIDWLSSDIHVHDCFRDHGVSTSMVGMAVGDVLLVRGTDGEILKEMTVSDSILQPI
jgi:hypothetical protein